MCTVDDSIFHQRLFALFGPGILLTFAVRLEAFQSAQFKLSFHMRTAAAMPINRRRCSSATFFLVTHKISYIIVVSSGSAPLAFSLFLSLTGSFLDEQCLEVDRTVFTCRTA